MQTIDAANCRSDRAAELFDNSLNVIRRRADRLFAWLMIAQWIGGIGVALWISPRTWIGAESQTHWHVWAAIFLGGAVTSLPVYFAHAMPGRALTRHTIAVAQMLFSALLIHLMGGRIETHFHVFGSLAFLAFYRDWRVLVTATVVVAVDHATRGVFFPQSVFGILTASPWRWIEHTGWVLFEDFFLFISIKQSTRIEVAERRADLEVSEQLEMRVQERTAELANANEALQAENTERKRGEESLRLSEGRYRRLFETAQDGILILDAGTGQVVDTNPYMRVLLGYSQEEFLGKKLWEIGPFKGVEATKTAFAELQEKDRIRYEGLPLETKDGRRVEVEFVSNAYLVDQRRFIQCNIRDITERKRVEERLLEQADIINRAQDAIIIRNFEDEGITFWNKGAEQLYGWSANEALGKPIGELIFADAKERAGPLKVLVSTGEFHGEIKQVAKDVREIIVDCRATLIRNADGTPRSVLLINTDVTEQKKLETHLLRAQRLESIGTLASGVAHDLNNILTPILMCAQTLRGDLADEDRQSALALIEESAQRGAGIVKQVLTFARGVEGERVLIKPSHLIQEIVDIARKTFPKSIEISGRYPDDLWSIEGDPTQLHQVLLNLSVNARDAMPDGGSLVIWAENFTVDEHYASMTPDARAGPFVALRVSDTGAGMPRAVLDKIFDPFFTTKEVGKGTGLGLSTTLGIVKSHRGFISVYSEQGKGTTFKLFLPATVTHQELQQSKTSVVPIQGNGELILVVDDEPNILGVTKMILEKHHYDVLSASDGPEALAIFAQQMQSIRLVLTDVSMPYMDGAALARALKKMKSDLPIIASTGQGEQAGLADFEALGVKNFLAKPYSTQQLLATVHDTLQEKTEQEV